VERIESLAIIGVGQMGGALARGFVRSGVINAPKIFIYDLDEEKLQKLQQELGVVVAQSGSQAVKSGKAVLIAVKPQQIKDLLIRLKNDITGEKILITIAAGISTNMIESVLGKEVPIVRIMPNSPALVREGVSAICKGRYASNGDVEAVKKLFKAVGEVIDLPEDMINTITAISGSGPAYFYLMVEAVIEAGRKAGLSSEVAEKVVKQTIMGAAKMLKVTGKSPMELREMVTSPGGTTEAALRVFKKFNFKNIVWQAVDAAITRAEELAK
jgi:pyrroline-5-carboxylate reductase